MKKRAAEEALVNVPVKQQDEDGSSGGDYGEVEVDGGSTEQQKNSNQVDEEEEQQEQVQVHVQAGDERMNVKVKSEGSDELTKSNGSEKTLLTYKRRAAAAAAAAGGTAGTAAVPLVTPKVEENGRPVRANRGMKRRYPGDESDETDAARKPARVRSMTEVFAESARYSTPSEQTGKGNVYICKHEGCDKVFTEPGALYRHARVHGDRPYVCHYEGCNRRFLERSKLKRHYLIHTGEKSFVCLYEGCGKAFSLDFNLRSHMKTHTGEYHECPHEGCEKKYCQNYKLRAHMCKDHNLAVDNTSNNNAVLDALRDMTPEMKAAKKLEKLQLLMQRREKLDKWRDGRRKRIQELEVELERESKELGKVEKALKKLEREKDQLEADDESEFESSDDSIEPDIEQATCEEREVLVFAQKLPAADHGARLVQADPRMMQPSSDVLVSRPAGEYEGGSGYLINNNESSSKNNNNNQILSSSSSGANGGSWQNSSATAATAGAAADSTSWSSSHHKLLLLQQSELPVTHLFSFQEQPCLVD